MLSDAQDSATHVTASFTWWGHSTVGIELDGVRILTDPVLGRWIGPLRRSGPLPSVAAISDLDAVLISHGHHDHLDLRSLRRIDRDTTIVVPTGRGSLLRAEGFRDVVELAVGDSTTIGEVRCWAVPAQHTGARWRAGRKSHAQGYLISGSQSVWFAGDTGIVDALLELRGKVDIGLVPIGGWGFTLGPDHLDAAQAAQLCAQLELAQVLPIHWGTFAIPGTRMFRAAWRRQDPDLFATLVRPPVHVLAVTAGQRVDVPAVPTNGAP